MNLLLDANVLIWLGVGSRGLSVPASKAIQNATALYYSPVSIAEIGLKLGKGGLTLQPDLTTFVANLAAAYDLRSLPFDDLAALELESLPMHHRDPFDRMLICQAIAHQLAVVSADKVFRHYPIKTIW